MFIRQTKRKNANKLQSASEHCLSLITDDFPQKSVVKTKVMNTTKFEKRITYLK